MKTYEIPELNLTVQVVEISKWGQIINKSKNKGEVFDAIDSIILGHACAGIDVSSTAYVYGLKSAFDAIANNS